MKVKELIQLLLICDPDMDVECAYKSEMNDYYSDNEETYYDQFSIHAVRSDLNYVYICSEDRRLK